MTTQPMVDKEIKAAQKSLKNLERALKGTLTSLHNCPIENLQKQSIQADLEGVLFEVHHLTPYIKVREVTHDDTTKTL